MDLAQTLIRSVLRAFYETRHVLIVDALIQHSALRDDDLAYIMKMNPKDLQKLCAKLKADRFITQHLRPEVKAGMSRPVNRVYYFVDYRAAIDAIKWRVYTVGKDIQGTAAPVAEKKEYFCSFCKAEWTMVEVLDSSGPEGFLCHRCGHVLTHDLERNSTGHEQSTKLNNQLKFITELLPKIDNVVVPDNNFDVAFSRARPVVRDVTHPSQASIPVESVQNRQTVVKGLANTGPTTISLSISAADGADVDKEAEKAKKEKAALQNALPSWMSNSTITGESFAGNTGLPAAAKHEENETKDTSIHSFNAKEQADMDDYFARLKREAAEQANQTQSQHDDEDEDEDDFEDVVSTTVPMVTDSPQAKRVRVAETVKTEVKDEESDDDIEFEDV